MICCMSIFENRYALLESYMRLNKQGWLDTLLREMLVWKNDGTSYDGRATYIAYSTALWSLIV
jgi:hypothetical protein